MGILNTLYIAGILFVIVPILLHLWRRRTEIIIKLPTVKYLIRAQQRLKKNIVFSDIFLMILRGLVFISLTLAMAQPYIGSPFVKSEKDQKDTAILIDTSMSMCADGFIKNAKRVASEIKDNQREPVLILTFNDGIVSSRGRGRDDKIITELRCTYKGTDIYKSIRDTADLLGEGEKFIYLLTDMTKNGWDTERIATILDEKHINLVIVDVAGNLKPKNYFIKDFVTEEIPQGIRIHLRVGSTSESDEEVPVSLNLENSSKLRAFTHFEKDVEFTIQGDISKKGFIELSGDELKEDNRYYFFLDIKKKPKILIVDGEPDIRPFRDESYFLLRAISALKERFKSEITVVRPAGMTDLKTYDYNIFFLLNVPQLEKQVIDRIMQEVENGAGLFLTSGNNMDINWFKIMFADKIGIIPKAVQEGEFYSNPSRIGKDFFEIFAGDERLFRDIVFRKRLIFIPLNPERIKTNLSFSDGPPALLESVSGRGVVLIFASSIDTDWTNFPLSGIFLPFIHSILMKLSAGGKPDIVKNLLIGEHNLEFSENSGELTLTNPDGEKLRVIEQNKTVKTDLNIPGIWRLENYILTVNTDPEESEMVRLDRDELKKILGKRVIFYEGEIKISNKSPFKPLWQYFIIMFGFFVLIESILSGRKR